MVKSVFATSHRPSCFRRAYGGPHKRCKFGPPGVLIHGSLSFWRANESLRPFSWEGESLLLLSKRTTWRLSHILTKNKLSCQKLSTWSKKQCTA